MKRDSTRNAPRQNRRKKEGRTLQGSSLFLLVCLFCLFSSGLLLSLGSGSCCRSSGGFCRGCNGLLGLRGIRIVLQREEDDLLRALLGTHTAALALVIIHTGHTVHNVDGIKLAGTLAHAAGNAGGRAGFHGHRALILVGAHDHRLAGAASVDHNHMLGADVGAGTAAGALVLIHLGHAVHNVDGVKLTDLGAVAQADAGERAGLGAAVQVGGSRAGLDAGVIISGLAVLGVARRRSSSSR